MLIPMVYNLYYIWIERISTIKVNLNDYFSNQPKLMEQQDYMKIKKKKLRNKDEATQINMKD